MKKISDFANKNEFYNYLVTNKKELIELKKSLPKMCDAFGVDESEANVVKALNTNYKDDVASGTIKRTIIANTYNWMDSHDDVHLDGVFSKSISERHNKIWHLHDHEYKITSKVGKPISIYEKTVAWADLVHGNKKGNTMALFMDSEIIRELNPTVFNGYFSKEINQHSVAMQYVQLDLAVNDEDLKDEYATWNKYIHLIGNRSKAEEKGYFWAVKEAKLIEISCVLEGSNELTPTVDNKNKPEEEIKTEPDFFSKLAMEFVK